MFDLVGFQTWALHRLQSSEMDHLIEFVLIFEEAMIEIVDFSLDRGCTQCSETAYMAIWIQLV